MTSRVTSLVFIGRANVCLGDTGKKKHTGRCSYLLRGSLWTKERCSLVHCEPDWAVTKGEEKE